tara:strand:+ start:687 stop:806 length:120 start_codon:yes stop_codon:yes gene_type:complete
MVMYNGIVIIDHGGRRLGLPVASVVMQQQNRDIAIDLNI